MSLSNNTLTVLAIITIIISVVSTYIIIENTDVVPLANTDNSQGEIGLNVIQNPPTGEVGVTVLNPNENTGEE